MESMIGKFTRARQFMAPMLLAGALALGVSFSASATLMIVIDDDGICTPSTGALCDEVLIDQGSGDLSGVLGRLLFDSAVGDFEIIGDAAFSKPLVGSTTDPLIDYDFAIIYSGDGSDTLRVWVSEIGFISPTGEVAGFLEIDGNNPGGGLSSLAWEGWVDDANGSFGMGCSFGSTTGLNDSVAGLCPGIFAPYALTTLLTTNFNDCSGRSNCFITGNAFLHIVSEPATLFIFGLGLLGLGFMTQRRRKWLGEVVLENRTEC